MENYSGFMLPRFQLKMFSWLSVIYLCLSLYFSLSIVIGAFDKPPFTFRIFKDHTLEKLACLPTGHVTFPSFHQLPSEPHKEKHQPLT